MLPFSVERSQSDHEIHVVVHGELDMDTGPRLEEELRAAEALDPAVLVLDLRGVTFFDSTGLEIVLDADMRARAAGRDLVILPGDGEPRRVMDLAEVSGRLRLEVGGGDGR